MIKKNKKNGLGMVDISLKEITRRVAVASGVVYFKPAAFKALAQNKSPKGDVLQTAKIAGIMAAKKTPDIIPLCHPLLLTKVDVSLKLDKKNHCVLIESKVISEGRTGVEMEALSAVTAAALTVYDMMKWAGQEIVIAEIKLEYKFGGVSGEYKRKK